MSKTGRVSPSLLLILGTAVSLWAQRFLGDRPFPYALAVFAFSVVTVALAWTLATGASVGIAKRIVRVGVAAMIGILGLLPVGVLFDHMRWPIFHSWGLGHGGFLFVVPWIGFLIYWVLGMVPWLRESAP